MNFELIELIVAGPLHGDVQQQPVLLPAATARLHEARRDGAAPARPGNPIDYDEKSLEGLKPGLAEMDQVQHQPAQGAQ